jgi:hypothetical protein
MIGEKTTLEILLEIQDRLKKKGYPVRIDVGEPIEGADIGIKVFMECGRNWELERKVAHEIFEVLDKYDLIPFFDWKWLHKKDCKAEISMS